MIMPLKGGGLLIRGLHCSTRSQGLVVEFLEKIVSQTYCSGCSDKKSGAAGAVLPHGTPFLDNCEHRPAPI